MAKFSNINTGAFSGAIGPVIGGSWKGIPYMRAKPGKRKKKASPLQKANEAKFKIVGQLLKPMSELFRVSFNLNPQSTGYACAFSYNFKNCVTGVYPKLAIDHPSVLVSRGDLPGAEEAKAVLGENSMIEFSWKNNSGFRSAKATDRSIAVIYYPQLNVAIYNTEGTARKNGQCLLDAGKLKGKKVHCWMAFISANGKEVSDSVYAGELEIKAEVKTKVKK